MGMTLQRRPAAVYCCFSIWTAAKICWVNAKHTTQQCPWAGCLEKSCMNSCVQNPVHKHTTTNRACAAAYQAIISHKLRVAAGGTGPLFFVPHIHNMHDFAGLICHDTKVTAGHPPCHIWIDNPLKHQHRIPKSAVSNGTTLNSHQCT